MARNRLRGRIVAACRTQDRIGLSRPQQPSVLCLLPSQAWNSRPGHPNVGELALIELRELAKIGVVALPVGQKSALSASACALHKTSKGGKGRGWARD